MMRTITGLFDTRSEAEAVAAHLRSHDGIDASSIAIHGQAEGTAAAPAEDRGFWASMRDLFIADEDRYAYSEGIRRGGYVVSAQVPEAILEHALDVFEEHGAVDLDSREAEWRSSGWQGYQASATDDTSAGTGMPVNTSAAVGAANMGGTSVPAVGTGMAAGAMGGATGSSGVSAAGASTAGMTGGETREERIPIVEEQLRVAKREAEHGRVRVRSYVVEEPVSEAVTLREEHVSVERRPVDLPASAVDDAFRERTIEAVEHAEEAVVSKEARVKEELVIRKQAEERTQTVSDTVRRTEVEVEDDRTAGATTRGTPTGRTPGA